MKILITGASGSGTTTLGKALATSLECGFADADDFFWMPTEPLFQERRNSEERLKLMLQKINQTNNVVVSGSITDWGLELEDSFDLIAFLYLDAGIRVKRVEQREIQLYGKADPEFLQWVSEYDTGPKEGRSLAKQNNWLNKRKAHVLRIEGDLTVEERLNLVLKALP